jgi:hypothetical protein
MARKHNLAEVLQTEVTGSMPLKTLAKVLASKGRRGDTMLAHITPKEAKKLKKAGGAGTTNPETGLPEFYGEEVYTPESYFMADVPDVSQQMVDPNVLQTFQTPESTANYFSQTPSETGFRPGYQDVVSAQQPASFINPQLEQTLQQQGYPEYQPEPPDPGFLNRSQYAGGLSDIFNFGGQPQQGTAVSATGVPLPPIRGFTAQQTADYYSQGATPEDPGVQTQIEPTSEEVAKAQGGDTSGLLGKLGLSDLLKLGVGGIGALMGRSQQQAAIKQAAAAAQQYRDAAAAAAQQYQQLAQPLLGPGYSALSQAQQGALTAANRQAFDIARARAAQASERSGGVGAVQAAMEESRNYQQLVSNQLQQAMQLIAPGNSLASAAISTTLAGQQGALKLQLDLENQANQAAMNMYSALAKMVA